MNKRPLFLKQYAILGLVCFLACVGYLAYSLYEAGLGFPLDDAWIHQTFARNFADSFTWSFQLGQPSGGSTGPIWGFLLSGLYLLGIQAVWGTHFIGFLLLWGCSIVGYQLGRKLLTESKGPPIVFGVLIALEWHLVWSALSGMETLLLVLAAMLIFSWLLDNRNDWWIPGVLTGIMIWVRPDGITLLGPIMLSLLLRKEKFKSKVRYGAVYLVCVMIFAGFYFGFNQIITGDFWPNTFYAKQAEYAILRETSIAIRYGNLAKQILTGVGIVLFPGLARETLDIYRRKDWERFAMLLWAVGYVGIYAWRLPVAYQHGRYIIPALPVLIILSANGMAGWLDLRSKKTWYRVLSTVWAGAAAAVLVVFYGLGARAYGLDVGVIETEMVKVARWVKDNTPSGAVIAAHDIGGLGYYGERQIIDMAGLISPEVIPFIRDQDLLSAFLDENDVDYLVTFPDWYPELVKELQLVYSSGGEYSEIFGSEKMSVYLWK